MILGIGTDICSISRIADVLEKQGARFVARCFSSAETAYIEKISVSDPSKGAAGYAKRWAAKEACAKALGLGIREDIFLKDIIVENDGMGKPALRLEAGAKERLTHLTPRGMTAHIDVSLSDDADMALAFVVISAR